jgi:hypothetical protein
VWPWGTEQGWLLGKGHRSASEKRVGEGYQ